MVDVLQKENYGPLRLGHQALRVGRIARHEAESFKVERDGSTEALTIAKAADHGPDLLDRALNDPPERDFIGRGRR